MLLGRPAAAALLYALMFSIDVSGGLRGSPKTYGPRSIRALEADIRRLLEE